MQKKEIVLGVTGSIAVYKAAELVSTLTRKNFTVTVVMTESARKFIQPLTFETLSQNQVITDLFTNDKVWDCDHIALGRRASLIIIAPASANIIGKIAHGIADDFLTTLIISSAAPVLICPAMNSRMYKNSFVQENIKKLKKANFNFLGPAKGHLACGDEGLGRLIDVEKIVLEASKILELSSRKTGKQQK